MATVKKLLEEKGNDVLSVSPETKVRDAIGKMAEKSAGTALVIDAESLVGIVSERDFIRKVALQDQSGNDVTVNSIMSSELTTVSLDTTLETCMAVMTEKRIRHLPVLEEDTVQGIISIGDIVKHMVREKDFVIKNLENYIAGPGL